MIIKKELINMCNENKSNWYFNAILQKESSRIELFSNAYQIILFPTPVVTFSALIWLDGEKTQARSKSRNFHKTITYFWWFCLQFCL